MEKLYIVTGAAVLSVEIGLGGVGHSGRWRFIAGLCPRAGRDGVGAVLGVGFDLRQRLLERSDHELPLGVAAPQAGALPFQMGLDVLEKLLVDLEGEGAVLATGHDCGTPVSFQFGVFGDEGCDVLAGGLACLVFSLPLVQVDWNLGTEIFGGCHGCFSFPLMVTAV